MGQQEWQSYLVILADTEEMLTPSKNIGKGKRSAGSVCSILFVILSTISISPLPSYMYISAYSTFLFLISFKDSSIEPDRKKMFKSESIDSECLPKPNLNKTKSDSDYEMEQNLMCSICQVINKCLSYLHISFIYLI